MEKLEQMLARRAAGVDWKVNPLLALGLGRELTVLNIPIAELQEVVKQYIRGVLRSYHPDINKNNPHGEEVYKKFAEIGDVLDKPEVFAVAWREFCRLSEGIPIDALTKAQRLLTENEAELQGLREENAQLQKDHDEQEARRYSMETSLQRAYHRRLQELLLTPAFATGAPPGALLVHRYESVNLLTIRFHVGWGTLQKGGNPQTIVAQALGQSDPFPLVKFTEDRTVNFKIPKPSESLENISDKAVGEAYRSCLKGLGDLLARHKRVRTFWAIPTMVAVRKGHVQYKSPEGADRERVVIGSLSPTHPQYNKRYIFITSKRSEELEVVPSIAGIYLKPLIIESHLLVTTALQKPKMGNIFVEQQIASDAPEIPLRTHEFVVRILSSHP